MTRRPSRIILAGGFIAAFGVGVVLAQFDLSFQAVLAFGYLATVLLGAIALGLELLHQTRPPRPNSRERRQRA